MRQPTPNPRAAELADIVDRATGDLLQLIRECPADFWRASPDPDDPRSVGVIVHHVGVSQRDVADWIRKVLRGERLHVTPEVVHGANAVHAEEFGDVTPEAAAEIVEASGREVAGLLRGLTDADMEAEVPREGGGNYRVDRFAEIAGRHPVTHTTVLRQALAAWPPADEPEEAGPPAEFDEFTVVLLVRPPGAPRLDDQEAGRLQRQHLGHLRAMQRRGALLAAGPLREQPDEAWRGLCLYGVGLAEALELARSDPAVIRGWFTATAWTWRTPKGSISRGAAPWTSAE